MTLGREYIDTHTSNVCIVVSHRGLGPFINYVMQKGGGGGGLANCDGGGGGGGGGLGWCDVTFLIKIHCPG